MIVVVKENNYFIIPKINGYEKVPNFRNNSTNYQVNTSQGYAEIIKRQASLS